MRSRDLKRLLKQLNSGKGGARIHRRPLTGLIELGQVWFRTPRKTDSAIDDNQPHTVFFIRNESGVYVSCVYDMGPHDLHWYTWPEHRRNGHLREALRGVILPYLFAVHEREEQRITLVTDDEESEAASLRLAESLGFIAEDHSYVLRSPTTYSSVRGVNQVMSEAKKNELKALLIYHRRMLHVVASEIEMHWGEVNLLQHLEFAQNQLRTAVLKLEDLFFDQD